MTKLGVAQDTTKAKPNEELLATISKASLSYMTLDVLTTMIDLCKKRTVLLLEEYTKLKELYSDLDGILSEKKCVSNNFRFLNRFNLYSSCCNRWLICITE